MPVEVRDLSVTYGHGDQKRHVLNHLNLRIDDGEFLAILGPSGCGKSTLLRAIGGFVPPSAGSILKDGKELLGPGSDRSIVAQQNALFPWLTVLENISYPLRIKGIPLHERQAIAHRWLERIDLKRYAMYFPGRLSIGMQQRVALARLFASDADVLLLDEPLAALDTVTRAHSQQLLMQIWERERRTIILVTHDVEEALLLADRIVVLGGEPTHILKEVPVRWPRPRDFGTQFTKSFVEARRDLLGLIGAFSI